MDRIGRNTREIFIEGWGRMGACWGVGKVMAEIQALLYLSPHPLSLEEMSEQLRTSRSNISLNVRALQELGVVKKVIMRGDRKDYYAAEEDVLRVARRLAAEKKKRELDPALDILDRALEAARSHRTDPAAPGENPDAESNRLHQLRRLIETIGTIFDAFIDGEPLDVPEPGTVKTQNL